MSRKEKIIDSVTLAVDCFGSGDSVSEKDVLGKFTVNPEGKKIISELDKMRCLTRKQNGPVEPMWITYTPVFEYCSGCLMRRNCKRRSKK